MKKKLPHDMPLEEGLLPELMTKIDAFQASLDSQQRKAFIELMDLIFSVSDDDEKSDEFDEFEDSDSPIFIPADVVRQLTVKVKLLGVKPLIWRKLEVPSNMTMGAFSELVNIAMGWYGGHLHAFRKGRSELSEEEEFWTVLGQFLQKKGDKLKYEYDFGDGWVHEIELVADPVVDDAQSVQLVSGKNACPPEDFGGPWRYHSFLEALRTDDKERLDDEFEGIMDWLPEDFDPDRFDSDDVQGDIDSFISMGEVMKFPF